MPDDKPLKSALELAMERLKQQDADAGVESRRLTDGQKSAIAEVRSFYDAQLAKEDVLYQSKLRTAFSAEARDAHAQEFRRERDRLISERDAKIERIRRGEG
jgi:hypothetical protein